MLWKCCTQYAGKFGKLSRGHRTGKGQFSFQSQRRAMPKNAQTTIQLHSFHMLDYAQNSPSQASANKGVVFVLFCFLPTKVHLVKAVVFPVVMYGCEKWTVKESWRPKNWCFWTVVLEKILESPLDCKEIQPVHRKGNQSWIFTGRTDAEAETPILWSPHAKNWLMWKDPAVGKDWRWEEKGLTEEEMVGCHHRLNGHEFE